MVARGRVGEKIPQAKILATQVRQKSKKEFTKGSKRVITKMAQRKQNEDRQVKSENQKMKRSDTKSRVGKSVTEMQKRKTSKISNRKNDQPVAQDGWLGGSVSPKRKIVQNDVLLPKERTFKKEQTTTFRVGYAALVSEPKEKCHREKVRRVYPDTKRNSTFNKNQHQERKRALPLISCTYR